jgi:hypothetical protein
MDWKQVKEALEDTYDPDELVCEIHALDKDVDIYEELKPYFRKNLWILDELGVDYEPDT